MRRLAVVSLLATCVSCGLTGCDSDSGSDDKPSCDEALKPATALSCDCIDGAWQMCVYPAGDKCAASNCGPGTVCDSNTGNCVPNGGACKCDDGSDCPDGDKAKCAATQTCKCDDGSDCPDGDKAKCPAAACKCDDGSDCPDGDKAKCPAAACKCDDGSDCPEGDKAKCPAAACKCDDGSDCPEGDKDKCEAAACKCDDGSDCPEGDKDKCTAEACKCDDGSDCPEGDKDKCTAEACKCDDGSDCPEGDKDKCEAAACKCDDGSDCPEGDKDKCTAEECFCDDDKTVACPEGDKDKCGAEADACDGKACKTAGTCADNSGTCACNNGGDIASGCCDPNAKAENATCTCIEIAGMWANDCTYTCPTEKPKNSHDKTPKDNSCQCSDATNGQWKDCRYDCDDTAKPENADTCDCDETTGDWKPDTCTYTCTGEKPKSAHDLDPNENTCQCDKTNGQWKDCKYDCPAEKPDKAVESSCTCQETNGIWECTEYIACETADKPNTTSDPHVKPDTCKCVEAEWQCEYEACDNNSLPQDAESCACYHGEWVTDSCTINKCKNKTWFSYQKCDPATGNITLDHEPKLIISGGGAISENGGKTTFTVKLSDEPGADVPLTLTSDPASTTRVTITEPAGKKITKTNWNNGVTYTVTAKDNSDTDGNLQIKYTVKADTNEVGYKNKSADVNVTVNDDEKPSIILGCDSNTVQVLWLNGDDVAKEYNDKNIYTYSDGIDDENSITYSNTCFVKLGSKPSGNVDVKVMGSWYTRFSKPTATINGQEYPDFWKAQNLTFTPENYDRYQEIKLKFINKDVKLNSAGVDHRTEPFTYTFSASSHSSNYKADTASAKFKLRPWPKYIHFVYSGQTQYVTLPKGKFRLHAWGASGGDASYKAMKTDSTTGQWACYNHGGAGAYVHGILDLTESATNRTMFVRVGGVGKDHSDTNQNLTAYNGGGYGSPNINGKGGCSGGGATDFCIDDSTNNCSKDSTHWPYRILVAGGGGGCSASGLCDTDYSHGTGGDATYTYHGGHGHRLGASTYQSNGNTYYYAKQGWPNDSNLTGRDLTIYNQYGNTLFGNGMNFHGGFRVQGDDGIVLSIGGGGGGWYGGMFDGKWKNTGGGAGSSYIFTGANQGKNGQQLEKYKLTNGHGANGNNTEKPIFNSNISKIVKAGKFIAGPGAALIETLYDD